MQNSQDGSRVVVAKVGAIVNDEPLALRLKLSLGFEFSCAVRLLSSIPCFTPRDVLRRSAVQDSAALRLKSDPFVPVSRAEGHEVCCRCSRGVL